MNNNMISWNESSVFAARWMDLSTFLTHSILGRRFDGVRGGGGASSSTVENLAVLCFVVVLVLVRRFDLDGCGEEMMAGSSK